MQRFTAKSGIECKYVAHSFILDKEWDNAACINKQRAGVNIFASVWLSSADPAVSSRDVFRSRGPLKAMAVFCHLQRVWAIEQNARINRLIAPYFVSSTPMNWSLKSSF